MKVVDWGDSMKESWRPGSETRFHASARSGAERLCVGEQWFEPGVGTPVARHADEVEEVISILHGVAEVTVDGETQLLTAGQSAIVPGGSPHQVVAAGEEQLHIWFVLSAPAPVAYLAGDTVVTMGSDGNDASA